MNMLLTNQGLQSNTPEGKITGQNEDASAAARQVFDNGVPLLPFGLSNPEVDLSNMGQAPNYPDFVKKDTDMIKMQNEENVDFELVKKKDAELAELRKQIDAENDTAKKGVLMVKAVQIKAESSQAEYNAGVKNKEIQKRAKLLIDIHLEETPPAKGDQKTPPPAP